MQNNPFNVKPSPFSLKNKILLILSIILGLGLLFFFAFTAFLIGAVLTIVGFLINLFSNMSRRGLYQSGQYSPGRSYRPPRKPEDDDVIDI
jgi:hypothetical protein